MTTRPNEPAGPMPGFPGAVTEHGRQQGSGCIYSAHGIGKRFGAQMALQDVDFTLTAGTIVGLIGANGAGKSTLVKVLSGVLAPDAGELRLDGQPIRFTSMLDAWRSGIALVSQELNLFPALSIVENLSLVPGQPRGRASAARHEAARHMLQTLGVAADVRMPLGTLSLGDRQLVELARALLQKPRVLILDEPTSALHAAETERLHRILRDLRRSGVGIVYVSHFLQKLLEVSDAVVVLREGRGVLALDQPGPGHLNGIVTAMLGSGAGPARALRAAPRPAEGPGLSIDRLRGPLGLRIDRLRAARGEVVGVVGLAGAGVEELFAILFGRVALLAGTVGLPSGAPFRARTAALVQAGVAFVPADRKRLGLSLDQSVTENVLAVRSLTLARSGVLLNVRRAHAVARARCAAMGVALASTRQRVGTLSGGNQQKVAFARWIEADPSLVLLDDPMRGVDVGAKRDLYALIRGLAGEGRVVLLYTSDPAEFAAVADRVLVFVSGRIEHELRGDAMAEHAVVAAMNTASQAQDTTPFDQAGGRP